MILDSQLMIFLTKKIHTIHKGFTLLEILIVISIFIIIMTASFMTSSSLNESIELNSFTEDTISFLAQARAQTLSAEGGTQYGVHFETGQVILFTGAVFGGGASDNKVLIAPRSVEIGSIVLTGGGSDTIFKRLTGETDEWGTVVIRLKSDLTKTRTVNIEKTGVVGIQ